MLAPGILAVAMLMAAGLPICDSGSVARAEDTRPVLKKSDLLPIPVERETARDPHERFVSELRRLTVDYHQRHALEQFVPQPAYERRQAPAPVEYNPDVERERRRPFLRGDFWTPNDFNRAFPRGP
jgi:hypothetical protein